MSTYTTQGDENLMRWDRHRRPFMEVWYATLTHAATRTGLWFRYTITSPVSDDPYCEVWAFAFGADGPLFAGKERFSIDRLGRPRDDGAIVRIANNWLSETHLEGEVESGGKSMAWSLDIEPSDRCFQHLPPALRGRVADRVSTVCSPNLDVPFRGEVKLDDRIVHVDGDRGCQSHRWGRRHSTTWAWAHCSSFEQHSHVVFEGVAAQAPLGPFPGPTMTFIHLNVGGEEFAFNGLREAVGARSHYEMPTWAFTAQNKTHKLVGAARSPVARLVQVTYRDPDGTLRFCANSEVGDLALELFEKTQAGWRHIDSFSSLGGAHLEFGRPQPFEALPVAL